MKRIVSFIVVLAVAMCGMTQVMAQKSITKEAKKVEREIKKQERLAQDAVEYLSVHRLYVVSLQYE